ncbi:MAG: hypothetical protein KAT29_05220, partial [Anaerolineales bacterium]|nr:hypothetical protein [Anaerolineales bacterium]
MESNVLLVRNNKITLVPRQTWQAHIAEIPEHASERLAFMSDDHHRIRNFVVRELPRFSRPITLQEISRELELSQDRVNVILQDLEQRLFFLVRDDQGAVVWAYPLTTERTPH